MIIGRAGKKSIRTVAYALTLTALTVGYSAAEDGDPAKGEKAFKACAACHKVGDGAKNGVGPVLTGIVGRSAGTFEGYKYGKGLQAANEKGLVWTEELLFEWLGNPKDFIRGYLDDNKAKVKMTFKLKNEQKRLDVIAYLKTVSPEQ